MLLFNFMLNDCRPLRTVENFAIACCSESVVEGFPQLSVAGRMKEVVLRQCVVGCRHLSSLALCRSLHSKLLDKLTCPLSACEYFRPSLQRRTARLY